MVRQMFEQLEYRFKLWRLQRNRARISQLYKNEISSARQEKISSDEIEKLRHEERFETELVDDAISELATRHLYQTAYRYLVPQPGLDEEEMWEESPVTGKRLLTSKGISELRAAIRKERRERSEHLWMWLAGLTGLVGALSGLMALLKG